MQKKVWHFTMDASLPTSFQDQEADDSQACALVGHDDGRIQ